MDLLVVPQPCSMLGICALELLDRREVGLEVLDVCLKLQHARVAVGPYNSLQLRLRKVGVDGAARELLPHVVGLHHGLCLRRGDGGLRAPQLAEEVQRQLLVLLPGLLQLVAPGCDSAVEFLQRPLLLLHLVDQVDLLALCGTGLLDNLVALLLKLAQQLVLLRQGLLELVVRVEHDLGFVVEGCVLLLEICQRLLSARTLLCCPFRVGLGLLRVLHHVVSVKVRLLDVAPHVFALFGRLLHLGLCLAQLLTTNVHDLVVQLAHLLLHRMVLCLDVAQLARPGVDKLFKLLELGLVL
mmetsp:Transcript_90048/g.268619  ORF Transcript_90048/g.268619 Transcript_90048/m.268619 type:complete len:297 (-) Transcript_90048:1853-2743(-)